MRSRSACKKTLAPAVTVNWLRIMAAVAGVAGGGTFAQAADEADTTSIQKEEAPGKMARHHRAGGAYGPDYEGSDDYEFQPFPFVCNFSGPMRPERPIIFRF